MPTMLADSSPKTYHTSTADTTKDHDMLAQHQQ
jgi:hypothetical protein